MTSIEQNIDHYQPETQALIRAYGGPLGLLLWRCGYRSPEQVRATPDQHLLTDYYIGPRRLAKIREKETP